MKESSMSNPITCVMIGYDEEGKRSVVIVRQGDQRGTYVDENHPQLVSMLQEVAELGDSTAQRWLRDIRQQQREA